MTMPLAAGAKDVPPAELAAPEAGADVAADVAADVDVDADADGLDFDDELQEATTSERAATPAANT